MGVNSEVYSARDHVAVTINTAFVQCRALYFGVGGNATITVNGVDVLYKNVPSGAIIPVQATNVKTTNTTATDIVALY